MKHTIIALIGCGNMGTSLVGGLIANGHDPDSIHGADPDPLQRDKLYKQYKTKVFDNNTEAIDGADAVILAVKPQMFAATLSDIADSIKSNNSIVISIAAGVRLATIEKHLDKDHPIIRVMPNTPAIIRSGISALFANNATTPKQREIAEGIMRSVGSLIWLEDESLMDTVTALSGSGPAYIYLIMEVLEQAAVSLGLPVDQARLLTLETVFGAAKLALESGVDAASLRRQVTSPGGTTEQALDVLMQQGKIDQLFLNALTAAKRRSEELAELQEKI